MRDIIDEILEMDIANKTSHKQACTCRRCSSKGNALHPVDCNCHTCLHQEVELYSGETLLDEILLELSSSQITDAVSYNTKNAKGIGWLDYYDQIVEKVLKLNYSPDERAFAEAVAEWQGKNGLTPDGKIGSGTWGKLKIVIGISTSPDPQNGNPKTDRISANQLKWSSSDPFPRSFKVSVYNKAISNAKRTGRPFTPSLPNSLIVPVGNGQYLRKDAAEHLNRLLGKANSDIAHSSQNIRIKISSGYRSASKQFNLWDNRFKGYYNRAIMGKVIRPNDYGNNSINALARFIGSKTAAPGYSNHQNGLAIDFTITDTKGRALTQNSTKSTPIQQWRKTWFWNWLNKNAKTFRFYPYEKEPWHWEYRR